MSGKTSILHEDAPQRTEAGAKATVTQVAEVVQRHWKCQVQLSLDGKSFSSSENGGEPSGGLRRVTGELSDESTLLVTLEVARVPDWARCSATRIFGRLADLSQKIVLLPPEINLSQATVSLRVGIRIQAQPMSPARLVRFEAVLQEVNGLARDVQAELPCSNPHELDWSQVYKTVEGVLEPLEPIWPVPAELSGWARETLRFLAAGVSVGLVSEGEVLERYALAVLAGAAHNTRLRTLGRLTTPTISAPGLAELSRKAPGPVAVRAVQFGAGTNPYDLANEARSLLSLSSSVGKPILFVGTFKEIQSALSSGQGATNDPLMPVLRRIPEVALEDLSRFAIQGASQSVGGIPKTQESKLSRRVTASLQGKSSAETLRLLSPTVNHLIEEWQIGSTLSTTQDSFLHVLQHTQETFGGVGSRPRCQRSTELRKRLTQAVTSNLLGFFQEHLLGQDRALAELVSRLKSEVLTRPLNQPIRWCCQGTPGTGKSESSKLLAERLGLPYQYVNAPSFSDPYTATAQLLGSGRGLVGSNQTGRLERCAKHGGVVLEVADLDHCPNSSVRSVLSDLFFEMLETGQAQSATGSIFSCANLIVVFTMNLPDGADEDIRKGFGFSQLPSEDRVMKRAMKEMKTILSNAFLSRVGPPILFDPLDRQAFSAIVERAVRSAMVSATAELGIKWNALVLAEDLGTRVVASQRSGSTIVGARELVQRARMLVAEAAVAFSSAASSTSTFKKLIVTMGAKDSLTIESG